MFFHLLKFYYKNNEKAFIFVFFFPSNCFREWKVVFYSVKNVTSAKKIYRNCRRFPERKKIFPSMVEITKHLTFSKINTEILSLF